MEGQDTTNDSDVGEIDSQFTININLAEQHIGDGDWEGAAKAYYEAARVAETELSVVDTARAYLKSAECYRKTLSSEAHDCYQKCIDAYVEDCDIDTAIHQSFKCGYIYETEFKNMDKSKDFYNYGAFIRRIYKRPHSCHFTKSSMLDLVKGISTWLDKDPEAIPDILQKSTALIAKSTICLNCIHFREILSKYVKEALNRELNERIEWIKENHEKFKDEVNKTIEHVEKLNGMPKNGGTDKDSENTSKDA